jgi:hypothetical protein
MYTLMLCRNPNKTVRYVNAMQKVYPVSSQSQHFLLKTWVANAYVGASDKRAIELFDQLTEIFHNSQAGYTMFMKLSYYALNIKMMQFRGNANGLYDELKQLITLCDKGGYKMIKVDTMAHVLSNFIPVKGDTVLFDRFYFDFVKTTRNSGCRPESFFTKPLNSDV